MDLGEDGTVFTTDTVGNVNSSGSKSTSVAWHSNIKNNMSSMFVQVLRTR